MPKGKYVRSKKLIERLTKQIRSQRPSKESLKKHYASICGEGNPAKHLEVRAKIKKNKADYWGKIKRADPKFRASNAMRRWAMEVKVRDKFTCQLCGVKPEIKDCIADHIKPYCLYPELALSLENGRLLCRSCHLKTPTYGTKALYTR